jgi:hypothetical protein
MKSRRFTQDFLTRLRGKGEMHCPATQDAIDKLAEEFGRGRDWMFDVLGRTDDSFLHELIMVGWAKAPLTLATDRSRSEWLDLMD